MIQENEYSKEKVYEIHGTSAKTGKIEDLSRKEKCCIYPKHNKFLSESDT